MTLSRGLLTHAGIFVVAGVLALRASFAGQNKGDSDGSVEIWGGTPAKIERIEFHTNKQQVTLEAATDENGRYFVGTLLSAKPAKGAPANPHAPAETPDLNDPKAEKLTERFIAVTEAQKLAEQLAPMRVARVLGKLDDSRQEEFGFDADHGTLGVTLGGKTHQLTLGGKTPGGGDVYARNPESGEGYVLSGKVSSPLSSAQTRLIERDLHGFSENDVVRVRISKGGASRELVKQDEQKGFWGDPSTPDTKDETASNWMSKLERLRVSEYLENPQPPVGPSDLVLRVDYFGQGNKALGFIEVSHRPPGAGSEQGEYCARTEHTRWQVSILRSVGEQLEQDVGSVLGK